MLWAGLDLGSSQLVCTQESIMLFAVFNDVELQFGMKKQKVIHLA